MAVAFGPTSCSSGLVPKSKLSHSPEAQYGFVPKHSLHGGKNIALRAEKPGPHSLQCPTFYLQIKEKECSSSRNFTNMTKSNRYKILIDLKDFSDNSRTSNKLFFSEAVFLPLRMSYVAKQCVMMSWLVRELAPRHKAMRSAQKLEGLGHRKRGF